jgi:hypothetical protein
MCTLFVLLAAHFVQETLNLVSYTAHRLNTLVVSYAYIHEAVLYRFHTVQISLCLGFFNVSRGFKV